MATTKYLEDLHLAGRGNRTDDLVSSVLVAPGAVDVEAVVRVRNEAQGEGLGHAGE